MKKLSDIKDKNELKKILDKSELYFDIENLCQSYNIDYVNEILNCFKSYDGGRSCVYYRFGDHYGQPFLSWFSAEKDSYFDEFTYSLEWIHDDYGLISDDMMKLVYKVIEIENNYEWFEDEYEEVYDYIDILEDYVKDMINEILVVPPEAVYEEFYSIVDSYDDLYVDDNGDIVDKDGDFSHC